MLTREEALGLLQKYLHNDKLINHSLAVEAILQAMAKFLHEDEELWGMTGLLHDLDYEYTQEDPDKHTLMTAQMLEGLLPNEAIEAIKAHNYQHTNQLPIQALDRALLAADAVSGLIIAAALVMPNRTLAEVTTQTLHKKFKDSSFASSISRKRIELCEDTGFDLERFFTLSLTALQGIHDKLGL